MSQLTTKAITYERPPRWRLTIKKFNRLGNMPTLVNVRSDEANPEIFVSNMSVHLNTTMSDIEFKVDNSDGSLDLSIIQAGNEVILQVAKDPLFFDDPRSFIFIGNIDYPNPLARGARLLQYTVRAVESKKLAYDMQIDMVKTAPVENLENLTPVEAEPYLVNALIYDLWSNKKNAILKDSSLQSRGGFDLSGIDPEVNVFWPKTRFRQQSAGSAMDEWAEVIGFNWYIDYTGGIKKLVVKYPEADTVPVVMKAGDTKNIQTDLAIETSYITEDIGYTSSSMTEANVASRLFATTKIPAKSIAGNGSTITWTSLTYKAICQRFRSIETNWTTLILTLSKVGDPQNPLDRLKGSIYTIKNGLPSALVMDFHIPLNEIEQAKTTIFVDLTEFNKVSTTLSGVEDFCLILWQCSGIIGEPNGDESAGIRWHRSTESDGMSLIAARGDQGEFSTLIWSVTGHKYAFNLLASINRLYAVTNYSLADTIGLREPERLDFTFLEDINIATKYLSSVMYYSSLFKAPFVLRVTLPDNFLFKPYQTVPNVYESRVMPQGFNLEIQEVEYNFTNKIDDCMIVCIALIDTIFPPAFGCSL